MEDQILDNQTRAELPVDLNPPIGGPGHARKSFFKNKKIIIPSVIGILAIVFIFWYFLFRPAPAPTSNNVLLQIKGPEQLTSGNETEYHIIYRNGENADLVGISLEVFYPAGFRFKSSTPVSTSSSGQAFNLPVLRQGQDGEVIIRGNLTGASSESKEFRATLHYRLSNFNSQFVVEQSAHTSILPPNLIMDISGPVNVVNGQDTTFTVTFTNVTVQDYDNLAVQLSYPAGFSFTSSSPVPTKDNNYWVIAKLGTSSSASIDITGTFTADTAVDKLVRADLGQIVNNVFAPQIVSTATFKIIPSSLSLQISSDHKDYVKLGDTINYKLHYANLGSIGLSNLVITLNLQGPSIDTPRISASNAIITGTTLTWKAATLSNLAVLSPNEKGDISFTVPIKKDLVTNLKNQIIAVTAVISSDELSKPTKANPLDLKIISQLSLDISGDYVSGAAPMTVGQTTTFAMTFVLSNLSNDLSDTEILASLPLPSSAWNNVVIPDLEKQRLSFDPNSGKIRWKIGSLPAFTGKFTPALKVTFQLQVTPSESDKGKVMKLLSDVGASGTDTFVNQLIQTTKVPSITVSDIDDDVMNLKGTTVQ